MATIYFFHSIDIFVKKVKIFEEITYLKGKKVVNICGSLHHTLFLLENGDVIGSGLNTSGQLGLGPDKIFVMSPILIMKGVKYIGSSVSGDHSYFIKKNDELFSVGLNIYGQLGHSTDTEVITLPQPCHLKGRKPIQVAGGCHFTILVASTPN